MVGVHEIKSCKETDNEEEYERIGECEEKSGQNIFFER